MVRQSSFVSLGVAVVLAALLAGLAAACQRPSAPPSAAASPAEGAAPGLGLPPEGPAGGGGALPPAPVDFARLSTVLPDGFGGHQRTGGGATRTPMGGFAVSHAEATYRSGGEEVTLTVYDGGDAARLVDMGAVWVGLALDERGPHGYERTTRFRGFPAYEWADAQIGRAELQAVVAGRFFVLARGRAMSDLYDAMGAADLDALAAMGGEGGGR